MKIIDVSSDNVTQPTAEMRDAMHQAPLVTYGAQRDDNLARLEALAAGLTGKEAALLFPTGTQANLVAILCQALPSQEVIVGPDSHIYEQELGGAGAIAGVMVKTWGRPGLPTPSLLLDTIQPGYRFPTSASPRQALVCLENSHNASGGRLISAGKMAELCEIIRSVVPSIHLDGARIFNAAAALETTPRQLCAGVDTVMFSLDKGLSAPFGAMLCGSSEIISRARRYRRMLGGYVRKANMLAAAGVLALEHMIARIGEDNQRSASLGGRLNQLEGIVVEPYPIPTNLVMLDLAPSGIKPGEFIARLKDEYGVLAHIYGRSIVRLAIHRHIGAQEEDHITSTVAELLKTMQTELGAGTSK